MAIPVVQKASGNKSHAETHKNIERHTAHTIVSWINPKQWQIVNTSDKIKHAYSHNHHKRNGQAEYKRPQYIATKIIKKIDLILDTHSTKCTLQAF